MNLGIMLLGLAMACMTVGQPESDPRRFRLDVPPHAGSKQTHLLLRDVAVSRNRPVVLRVHALAAGGAKVYLGSTAVPGIAPDAPGMTTLSVLRINVTAGFRRWFEDSPAARKVNIEIRSSDGGDSTMQRARWSIRAVELVHPEL
ncbi:MAG: hypothetical protein M3O61_11245 [Gemmatimonadota bacterium]|nr:hypothetical protein [Gemmatimonadota bacterium]